MKEKEIMKDVGMLIPVVILTCMLMIALYSNNNLRKINEDLKKEVYEYKNRVKEYEEKELERIIKGE